MTSSSVAIRVDHVRKAYANHVAVRDVSLSVPKGTVYGLLGPNGAGKTTTIRMILNLMVPDSGHIEVLGKPAGDPSVSDRVGYLPEERGLYRKMEVRRVLRFLGRLKGLPTKEADRRIDLWLDRMGLRTATQDWGSAKVEDLSRGMQQKVQFVGTMLHEPELVILDEPFSGLDPVNAQVLKDTVLDLRREGRTVIFSTHLMDNAERMCDAVAIIARGEVVADGAMSALKKQYGGPGRVSIEFAGNGRDHARAVLENTLLVASYDDHGQRVELDLAAGATTQQLLGQLVAHDVEIVKFDRSEASLHRIFLERVGATGVEAGLSGNG
ncbi:ATP-binding cassette domain-containing protein [Gemmatimonas sp.]|uniref:ABC transporter ATP-binding protein n=1 Tax=Gemmatimonas sp. TaxID=1962908 RepID=UPI00286DCDD2|nr:ATP-binding cassette domain-containing protein [Gemmatimonas sp.]